MWVFRENISHRTTKHHLDANTIPTKTIRLASRLLRCHHYAHTSQRPGELFIVLKRCGKSMSKPEQTRPYPSVQTQHRGTQMRKACQMPGRTSLEFGPGNLQLPSQTEAQDVVWCSEGTTRDVSTQQKLWHCQQSQFYTC